MTIESQAYEIDGIWDSEFMTAADHERIATTIQLLPSDISTLLDVGCGNGLFLNQLATQTRHFDRLCGVDRSQSALHQVRTETRTAPADQLPFLDAEFDIVTCLEVIEHLSLEVYSPTLAELARVAKKYIVDFH